MKPVITVTKLNLIIQEWYKLQWLAGIGIVYLESQYDIVNMWPAIELSYCVDIGNLHRLQTGNTLKK